MKATAKLVRRNSERELEAGDDFAAEAAPPPPPSRPVPLAVAQEQGGERCALTVGWGCAATVAAEAAAVGMPLQVRCFNRHSQPPL
jgi:hypothetical protein